MDRRRCLTELKSDETGTRMTCIGLNLLITRSYLNYLVITNCLIKEDRMNKRNNANFEEEIHIEGI